MPKASLWVILLCLGGAALLVLALLIRSHAIAAPGFIAGGVLTPTATTSPRCPGAPAVPNPQVKEFCAWNQDGHTFEHRVQVYQGSSQVGYFYGEQDANGHWQWQQQSWFASGVGVPSGIVKTYEYASHAANGAWQHQYDWRDTPTGPWNDCYAQSGTDDQGQARTALFVCHLASGDASGTAAPVPLANPQFRDRPHW
jgi:hypothetical protein